MHESLYLECAVLSILAVRPKILAMNFLVWSEAARDVAVNILLCTLLAKSRKAFR